MRTEKKRINSALSTPHSALLGFTLLELLISVSILLLVWGSAGALLTQVSLLAKKVVSQTQSIHGRSALNKFGMDMASLLGGLKGEDEKIEFLTSLGEVSYEFRGGRVYRCTGRLEQVMLEGVHQCRWKYLKENQWTDAWSGTHLPTVVGWEFEVKGKRLEMIYPIRVEN